MEGPDEMHRRADTFGFCMERHRGAKTVRFWLAAILPSGFTFRFLVCYTLAYNRSLLLAG
jgi:hypothetical protein